MALTLGLGLSGGNTWGVSRLFANGEKGAWFDPSLSSTLYQDALHMAPVTADGNPVGATDDRSRGLYVGPDLVTNGDFATDSDWVKGTGWTISGGVATHSPPTGSDIEQTGMLTPGQHYVLTLDIPAVRTPSIFYVETQASYSPIDLASIGTHAATFQAPADGDLTIRFGGPSDADLDNVTVRAFPGNHAIQRTDSKRPLYKTAGGLHWIESDGVDDALNATLPDLGTDATVAYASDQGVTIQTGQTIGAGAFDILRDTKLYGMVVIDRALSTAETTRLTAWLNHKAGV